MGAVAVAGGVVAGGGGEALVGQALGDGLDAEALVYVHVEDPGRDRRGHGVRDEHMEALAVGGLGRVGVGAGVAEREPVGRATAEVAAFPGLAGHLRADTDAYAVALGLRDAAEEAEDHVVGVVRRVVRPAELHWFVEVDRGDERAAALTHKTTRYVAAWRHGGEQARAGVFPRVLWIVPSSERAAAVDRLCATTPGAPVGLFVVVPRTAAIDTLTEPPQ